MLSTYSVFVIGVPLSDLLTIYDRRIEVAESAITSQSERLLHEFYTIWQSQDISLSHISATECKWHLDELIKAFCKIYGEGDKEDGLGKCTWLHSTISVNDNAVHPDYVLFGLSPYVSCETKSPVSFRELTKTTVTDIQDTKERVEKKLRLLFSYDKEAEIYIGSFSE